MRGKPLILSSLLFLLVIGFLFLRGYSIRRLHEPYEHARRYNPIQVFVPPQASDICYWVRPYQMSVAASFEIDEEAFLAWAKEKDWILQTISEPGGERRIRNLCPRAENECGPNSSVAIASGYVYHNGGIDRERGIRSIRIFAYDRDKKIGYFTQLED